MTRFVLLCFALEEASCGEASSSALLSAALASDPPETTSQQQRIEAATGANFQEAQPKRGTGTALPKFGRLTLRQDLDFGVQLAGS